MSNIFENFFGGSKEKESAEIEKERLDKAAENTNVEKLPVDNITMKGGVEDSDTDMPKAAQNNA